jgi:hypothetical protein
MRDRFVRGLIIGQIIGVLLGVLITQAYWGVGFFG